MYLKGNVSVHHMFDGIRIDIEIKVFRDLLLLFGIVQGHRCVNWFDFQLQSAIDD